MIIGPKKAGSVYRADKAKPSILSVLIYAYARALVWRTLCQHNIMYSDTDSGLFRLPDFEALRAEFGAMDPTGRRKELGDLEQELAPHAFARAYLLAPKEYAVFLYDAENKPVGQKTRAKGVHLDSDRRVIDRQAFETARDMSANTVEYHAAATTASAPIRDDVAGFFRARVEALRAGEKMPVLSSQIARSFRAGGFTLRQRFLLKDL